MQDLKIVLGVKQRCVHDSSNVDACHDPDGVLQAEVCAQFEAVGVAHLAPQPLARGRVPLQEAGEPGQDRLPLLAFEVDRGPVRAPLHVDEGLRRSCVVVRVERRPRISLHRGSNFGGVACV